MTVSTSDLNSLGVNLTDEHIDTHTLSIWELCELASSGKISTRSSPELESNKLVWDSLPATEEIQSGNREIEHTDTKLEAVPLREPPLRIEGYWGLRGQASNGGTRSAQNPQIHFKTDRITNLRAELRASVLKTGHCLELWVLRHKQLGQPSKRLEKVISSIESTAIEPGPLRVIVQCELPAGEAFCLVLANGPVKEQAVDVPKLPHVHSRPSSANATHSRVVAQASSGLQSNWQKEAETESTSSRNSPCPIHSMDSNRARLFGWRGKSHTGMKDCNYFELLFSTTSQLSYGPELVNMFPDTHHRACQPGNTMSKLYQKVVPSEVLHQAINQSLWEAATDVSWRVRSSMNRDIGRYFPSDKAGR